MIQSDCSNDADAPKAFPVCNLQTSDLDGDGSVAFADFLVLSANFGSTEVSYQEGDIDCDGSVAFADFLVMSANFGQSAAETTSVPEPRSILICLWIGLLAGIRKRRTM
jgi:hypothetical protein